MCTSPLYRIQYPPIMWKMLSNGKIDPKSKQKIVGRQEYEFMLNTIHEPYVLNAQKIQCRNCIECRIRKSQQWAVRLFCESLCHPKDTCWFITLTYAPENLPQSMYTLNRIDFKEGVYFPLDKKAPSRFMKNLRNKLGEGIKFFACGEYGPTGYLPHYHLCVFGAKLDDLKTVFYKKGHLYYNSAIIDECWKEGFAVISDFSSTNAQYTAAYCVKKFTGKLNKEYYELCNLRGVDPIPEEFIVMSNRPGLGSTYLNDNLQKILNDGLIYLREGKTAPIPSFYRDKIELLGYLEELEKLELEEEKTASYKNFLIMQQTDLSEAELDTLRNEHLERMSVSKRQF